MSDYTGDHRQCDCDMGKNSSQDISWNSKCCWCGKDLTNAPKASIYRTGE
jgi:hypothetical protein